MFKSGFVTIIGRPNVGKSTFLNACLGQKISIISPKAQTTRNAIKGIYTDDEAQIVFIDTPGIHKPKNGLGDYMNKQSMSSLNEADMVLWIVDGTEEFGSGDSYVIHLLEHSKAPVTLVINKIDLVNDEANNKFNREYLDNNINKFTSAYEFNNVIEISALNKTNVDKLIQTIKDNLDEGPMYYPKDAITDEPERFIVAEIIREKIFLLTKEEVPHSIAVDVDQMKKDEDGLMNIFATIYCDRKSQKKIIIGAGGKMIKDIGTLARKEIVMLLGEKIYLELWVKVEDGWRDKRQSLTRLGYK